MIPSITNLEEIIAPAQDNRDLALQTCSDNESLSEYKTDTQQIMIVIILGIVLGIFPEISPS